MKKEYKQAQDLYKLHLPMMSGILDLFPVCLVYYLLGKGGYVFGSVGLFVRLSVCLSVDNITQKVMNRLG